MQVTKKSKHIILISFFLFSVFSGFTQENTENINQNDTILTKTDSTKTKHKFSFSAFFKKKNKEKDEENFENDTSSSKKKFSFRKLFRRKNKQDSTISENDSLSNDSSKQKKRFRLFNRNKKDSTSSDSTSSENGAEKPQRITPGLWLKLNAEEQDSLLRAWDEYDRQHYVKKYTPSPRIKKIDMKRDKNFFDKLIIRTFGGNKTYQYRRKLINRRISRYRKTLIYDRLKKSDTAPGDTLSDKERYKIVNKEFKRDAKREAIRKNKISLKYDKKEERLRRRYKLSDNEMIILNKGKGIKLKGSELIIFKKAQKKQEKFSTKLLKLRRKRSFALQNKEVQKKMRKDQKRIAQRDKAIQKKINKKKRDKERNQKHDSSEYPKRWFK